MKHLKKLKKIVFFGNFASFFLDLFVHKFLLLFFWWCFGIFAFYNSRHVWTKQRTYCFLPSRLRTDFRRDAVLCLIGTLRDFRLPTLLRFRDRDDFHALDHTDDDSFIPLFRTELDNL